MDCHHLDCLADGPFDSVYTVETFFDATDPRQALGEFFRAMKPGDSIALYEYGHLDFDAMPSKIPEGLRESMDQVNRKASMPANMACSEGVLQRMLDNQGFQDMIVEDLSKNVKPMAQLFFLVEYIPCLITCFLGLQRVREHPGRGTGLPCSEEGSVEICCCNG